MESLSLASGLEIADPLARLLRFCEEEYEYYDAVPRGEPNLIEPIDVLATVGINSRIDTAVKVRRVHRGLSELCQPLLKGIREDANLLDDPMLEAANELLKVALQAKYVALSTACKVLHRKRPSLIPVLDSVVAGHYLSLSDRDDLAARLRLSDKHAGKEAIPLTLDGVRQDLMAAGPQLNELKADLKNRGYNLTPLRVLDILVWSEVEPSRYYVEVVAPTTDEHPGEGLDRTPSGQG